MLTQDAAIDIVRAYARDIQNEGVDLHSVILFGSYAKGTQHEWSDIDVALVADEFTGWVYDDHVKFKSLLVKKPYILIETKTYPTDYFRQSDPFIEEIKKDGIVILDK
jgi:predicted nucleotidyltransferase